MVNVEQGSGSGTMSRDISPAAANDQSQSWLEYLDVVMKNIATMLEYANENGIALPDDLRPRIEELLLRKEVAKQSRLFHRI